MLAVSVTAMAGKPIAAARLIKAGIFIAPSSSE